MFKAVIAIGSEDLCIILQDILSQQYEVSICDNGMDAVQLISGLHPDILILDLQLPCLDGLTLLEEIEHHRPPVILGLTAHISRYALDVAHSLGVNYILRVPLNLSALTVRLDDMVRRFLVDDGSESSAEKLVSAHLMTLGFQPKHDGYQQLRVAIPMYAKDPAQRICKELYPDVAKAIGTGSGKQVERSIRNVISAAFEEGDRYVWTQYFPNIQEPPTNKQFISRLAEYLINR